MKFVGTLDGKTCPYCASYDGYIWRGEEIAEARRPPIHPNCRCCLIPYVELKDDEGNVVDVDGERPAANADFDKLAQDAYNEHAREKGWKRRWDDLSPSTRLKYYYQAQKDYEAETGKPAYRQVSGATTFQEYFHRQPDSFKRAWLGAKRYELYKDGKLKEKNIFKPDLTYQVSVESLVRDDGRSIARFKNNKRKDRQDDIILNEPPISDEHYISKEPSFDGSNNVHELYSYWETLSLKELAEVGNRIKEHFTAWHSYINSKRPKQEDYSSIKLYEQDEQLWKQDKKDGNVFWRDIIYAFRSAKEEAKSRQEAEKFKNPFDSIMEPGDYQNNPETRKELERIEKQFKIDRQRLGKQDALERKCEALRRLILPAEPPRASIKAMMKKMPKKGFHSDPNSKFDKKNFESFKEEFTERIKQGLVFTARILENLRRSYTEVKKMSISSTVVDRAHAVGNLIYMDYESIYINRPQLASYTCVHESGHVAEYSNNSVHKKVLEFYEKHSVKDENGEYIKEKITNNEYAYKLDFETPDIYARRAYLSSEGSLCETELSSMFFQGIIENPEYFFDQRFKTFYSGMVRIWKKTN